MRIGTAAWLVLALITGGAMGWLARDHWSLEAHRDHTMELLVPDLSPKLPESSHLVVDVRPGSHAGLQKLLENRSFDRAVERYEAVQAQGDEAAVQSVRKELLDYAGQLITQADYSSAIDLLQRYLKADYRSVDARVLLAQARQGRGELRAAIDQLYEAKGLAWRPERLEQLERDIHALVGRYAATLRQRGDNAGLLALYQDLTQLEPSYAPYFIGLATAQLALDDPDAARQSLLLVAQDPDVGAQAQELLEHLRLAAAETSPQETSALASEVAGVPLQRRGSHFLVDARLGSQSARLLIDTGASLTMVTPALLQRRAHAAHDTGRTDVFNTANGRVRAPIYRLDALSVGDWQVSDLEVGVLDLGDPGIDGLLGMNFLRHFRFFLDQDKAQLRLSPAAESRRQ
jgi:clan AA aspartic protease (TIGR02281 family)